MLPHSQPDLDDPLPPPRKINLHEEATPTPLIRPAPLPPNEVAPRNKGGWIAAQLPSCVERACTVGSLCALPPVDEVGGLSESLSLKPHEAFDQPAVVLNAPVGSIDADIPQNLQKLPKTAHDLAEPLGLLFFRGFVDSNPASLNSPVGRLSVPALAPASCTGTHG